MAVVVLLRGVNVGGHRTFRPGSLARELSAFDVTNVGAAGTFVVRRPGPRSKLLAAIRSRLPFDAEIMVCDGRDLVRMETDDPFAAEPARPDITRFVSILAKDSRAAVPLPIALPSEEEWLLRIIARRKRFVFGVYRRQMKAIGHLGQIDKLFGTPVTTRNWNTILSLVRILRGGGKNGR